MSHSAGKNLPRKKSKPLLGNHQRCWIWGRFTVLETLRAKKWRPWELYLADSLAQQELEYAQQLAQEWEIPVLQDTPERLTKYSRSSEHQGYLAKMPPFPYVKSEDLLASPVSQAPLYVILDSLQDPFNLGAIVRSAEVMSVDAIFLSATHQVGVTSQVARSSAGAVNHIPIAQVHDLKQLILSLKSLDIQVLAASEKVKQPLFQTNLTLPTAILIGNEASGIQSEYLDLCDQQMTIPVLGQLSSLNAAVSAGIIFYESLRQRSSS